MIFGRSFYIYYLSKPRAEIGMEVGTKAEVEIKTRVEAKTWVGVRIWAGVGVGLWKMASIKIEILLLLIKTLPVLWQV